jgi:glutamine---fructose-6-phosphate transaminase (isomerizing)
MTNETQRPQEITPAPPGYVLAQEIASQPEVVERFIGANRPVVERIVERLGDFSYVVVAARGSSDHVGEYARYLLPMLWGTPVAPSTPSLHTHYKTPPRFDHALVVGISQSGQSPDVVSVLQEARQQGRPTLAITNDANSPLALMSDHVIPLGAGTERSIAATKTYTCQLAAMALLAVVKNGSSEKWRELQALPEAMQKTLALSRAAAATHGERWKAVQRCLIFARGINLGTAHEIALKLREVLRLQTQAFSAADFRHGSVVLLEPGLPTLVIAPGDAARGDILDLTKTLSASGADVLVIGEESVPGCGWLPLASGVPSWLSPLTAVLPAQLLALSMADNKGIDADRPVGLSAKVVKTV